MKRLMIILLVVLVVASGAFLIKTYYNHPALLSDNEQLMLELVLKGCGDSDRCKLISAVPGNYQVANLAQTFNGIATACKVSCLAEGANAYDPQRFNEALCIAIQKPDAITTLVYYRNKSSNEVKGFIPEPDNFPWPNSHCPQDFTPDFLAIKSKLNTLTAKTANPTLDKEALRQNLEELAALYSQHQLFELGIDFFKQQLTVATQRVAADDLLIASIQSNLASFYQQTEHLTESAKLYEAALAIYRQKLGNDNPSLAPILNNLALIHMDQGNLTLVEKLLTEAFNNDLKNHGEYDIEIASDANNLGKFYQIQKNYLQAETYFKKALDIFDKQNVFFNRYNDNHFALLVATTSKNLANCYLAQQRYADAQPLYEYVLTIHKENLNKTEPELRQTVENMIQLYQGLHNSKKVKQLQDYLNTLPPANSNT